MSSKNARCLDGDDCQVRVIHLDRVEQARRETVSEKELNWLASIYKVLGDPSRLKIVMALRNVEMCVCDLAAFLELTESAISHQLRRFKDLALVKSRREGQVIYYSLDDEHVAELLNVGLEHVTESRQMTEVRSQRTENNSE
jgi:DNA-binding transcriptional ArsR family regulator